MTVDPLNPEERPAGQAASPAATEGGAAATDRKGFVKRLIGGGSAAVFEFFWSVGQFDLALAILGVLFAGAVMGIEFENKTAFTPSEFAASLGFAAVLVIMAAFVHVTQLRTGRRFGLGPPASRSRTPPAN